MTTNMKKIFTILLVLLTFNGCNDVLDLTPPDRISSEEVLKSTSTIRLYMNATMPLRFRKDFIAIHRSVMVPTKCIASKVPFSYARITRGELTPDNVTDLNANIMNNWKRAYATIRSVNVFLQEIPGSPVDASAKATMTAEMRFVRAHQYSSVDKEIWRCSADHRCDWIRR